MSILNTVRNLSHRFHCTRKRRRLIGDLYNLSDLQLRDIGLFRGVIPDAATAFLASQGCPRRRETHI